MHIDICSELGELTPEQLARAVAQFRSALGDPQSFTAEVTPIQEGNEFRAHLAS